MIAAGTKAILIIVNNRISNVLHESGQQICPLVRGLDSREKWIMPSSDELAALSADDLWELHDAIAKLLVARLTERLRELDIFLAQIQPGSDHLTGVRQQKAA